MTEYTIDLTDKSDAYKRGVAKALAEIAERDRARVAGRSSPAPTVRTDAFRTGTGEAVAFRTDAADHPAPQPVGAAAARRALLAGTGMRADRVDHRTGNVDHAARAERDAAVIARLEATAHAQRVEMQSKLNALGIRVDAADVVPAAATAKARMQVTADLISRGILPAETRDDAADFTPDRKLSAAAARSKLHGSKG